MTAGLTFALSRLRLILLPLLLSGVFAASALAQSSTPTALYRLSGRTSGQALDAKAAVAHAVAPAPGAAATTVTPAGRVTALDRASLSSLTTLHKGMQLAIPLTDSLSVNGSVNLVVTDNGFTRSGGHLDNSTPGTFYFSSNGARVTGFVLRPDLQTAFRIETLANGQVVMREVSQEAVVCGNLPPFLNDPSKKAQTNDVPVAIVPPLLNSRPSAVAQLYLDFDGETVTDPLWDGGNTIVAPPAVVTATDINNIFARVKEDYFPFNVNVTTDVNKYNNAPVGKRMRCIITPNDQARPGSGGVAYLTSFRNAGQGEFTPNIPCWVFNPGVIGISEAISHELGHTFGLSHDGRLLDTGKEEYFQGQGTGPTSWCPIMGAAYYVAISQWSRGEYQYANNFEDDVAIISGEDNGIGYVPDIANDTLETATVLGGTSVGSISQTGVIKEAGENDYYTFTTTGGQTKISAIGAPDPNLDIAIEVLDSEGFPVVQSNPPDSQIASLTVTLPRGFYYLHVTDSGAGDPLLTGYSLYGSIGFYALSGTVPGLGVELLPNLAFVTPTDATDKLVISNQPGTRTDADVFYATDDLYVDFSVTNNGDSAAPTATTTSIYVDDVLKGSVDTPEGFVVGDTVDTDDYDIGMLPVGQHVIRIQADSGNTLKETNELDNSYSRTIYVTLPGPPMIYSATRADGQKGSLFYYQIQATNQPSSYEADNLPPGLYLKDDSNVITGIPTASGTFQTTIRATNILGTDEKTLTINIIPAVPVVANPGPLEAEVGKAYTYQISAVNDPAGYGAIGLPPGLTLDRATGVISGTPTTAGTYTVTFQASNTSGTGTATTTIQVFKASPVFTSPKTATGRVAQPFTYQIVATGATPGGYGADGLPDGLTVSLDTGLISGTPTKAGTYNVTIIADNGETAVSTTLALTITEAPPIAAWGLEDAIKVPADLDMADVVALSAGAVHSLALKGNGTVEAWGLNNTNQLNVPADLTNVVAISAGSYHNLALRRDGTVVAWGSNDQGQATVPADLKDVVAVAAGTYHSLALKSDGTVVAWGGNVYSQASPPAGLTGVVGIAAGAFHSVALKGDGTVTGWGLNGSGQLNFPSSLSGVKQIAAGSDFSLVLRATGSVVALGSNVAGQLVLPAGLLDVTEIAAGGEHGLAVHSNGTVSAWGSNSRGESMPPTVLYNVAKVAAGAFHSLALVQPGAPRAVAALPVNGSANLGGTVSLLAYGSATGAETYQWAHNGVDIAGATLPYLALSDLKADQAGAYTFRLTNASGSVTSSPATLAVSAVALPVVTVAATTPQAIAGAQIPGVYTLTRSGDTSKDLIVNYSVRGPAKNGVDYKELSGKRKIKAGKTSAKIKITPISDLGGANQKAVKLTLQPGEGYTVGTTTEVKVTIVGPQR